MSNFDQYHPDEVFSGTVSLDIPAFVRVAVRKKANRETILVYLYLVSQTYEATDKMRRFALLLKKTI